jgi:glutaminase
MAPGAAAEPHELQRTIDSLHERYRPLTDGQVASYIPELLKVNADDFGICIATAEGAIFQTGDCDRQFTIQSISKPFTFGMAIEAYGAETVAKYVGVEPSGDTFNSIALQSGSNRPHNPMINAGAITVSALLHAKYGDGAFDRILERFSDACGRQLQIDEAVFESERRTGHRNRAIAHLLLNFGLVHDAAEQALDVYFKQCSILVTCRDLAMMGAMLANMGRNALTGAQVFEIASVKSILSIMFTCGMYDYSGEWAYRVGVPAKSGVGGGVIAVVNRQLGIATYSPRLDQHGNSARGIEVCVELASRFGLHAFDCLNVGSGFLQVIL